MTPLFLVEDSAQYQIEAIIRSCKTLTNAFYGQAENNCTRGLTMRITPMKLATAALLLMTAGCESMGSQYSSNYDGSVDCKDFPIQSSRKDLRADNVNSCWLKTSDQVQYVGRSYRRYYQSNSGYMNALLQDAGTNTVLLHRDTRALANVFHQVSKEGSEWEDLPSIEANGRTYKLKSFQLAKAKHDCIAYSTYGGNIGSGYNSVFYGYSCQPHIQAADLKKDLDAITVKMY